MHSWYMWTVVEAASWWFVVSSHLSHLVKLCQKDVLFWSQSELEMSPDVSHEQHHCLEASGYQGCVCVCVHACVRACVCAEVCVSVVCNFHSVTGCSHDSGNSI